MDRATMVLRFHDRCANVSSALSDAEVYVLLNEQYCYAIPDDIPGSISDGGWRESTVASTQEYDYPDFVHSVRDGAMIDDNTMRVFFRPTEMWSRYVESSTTESKPHAVLF